MHCLKLRYQKYTNNLHQGARSLHKNLSDMATFQCLPNQHLYIARSWLVDRGCTDYVYKGMWSCLKHPAEYLAVVPHDWPHDPWFPCVLKLFVNTVLKPKMERSVVPLWTRHDSNQVVPLPTCTHLEASIKCACVCVCVLRISISWHSLTWRSSSVGSCIRMGALWPLLSIHVINLALKKDVERLVTRTRSPDVLQG
jgi:hypothetical protein